MKWEILVAGGAEAVLGFITVEGGAFWAETGVLVGGEVLLETH